MSALVPALRATALRALLLAPDGPLSRLEVVQSTGSTNDDVVADLGRDPGSWPAGSLLVADHQLAGRGRSGRTWVAPPRSALTCTFVVRPAAGDPIGWLPLLAGLAVVRALRATAGVPVRLKWPNDVVVVGSATQDVSGWGTDRKVAGILCDVVALPAGPAVAVGIGVNVAQRAEALPVPSATSLALAGARDLDREVLLVALVGALAQIADRWHAGRGDVRTSGLAEEVSSVCGTLGRSVRVDLPGGAQLTGRALRLADDGALVVRTPDGVEHEVRAGDVAHLRDGGSEG